MASFFRKLPLEIRNQIYGELLVSKEQSIAIQGKCPITEELASRKQSFRKAFHSPHLFYGLLIKTAYPYHCLPTAVNNEPCPTWKIDPAILQVCKQTNHEASTIFYSANRFLYDFCKPCTHGPFEQQCEADFLDRTDVIPHLHRIKHVSSTASFAHSIPTPHFLFRK